MAWDRIEPIGPETSLHRLTPVSRVERRTPEEEEREREERRREQRELDIERARLEASRRSRADDDDDERPHIDVRA